MASYGYWRTRVAIADRVDEDQVGLVEQDVVVRHQWYGSGAVACGLVVSIRIGPNEPICSQTLEEPGPPLYRKVTGRLVGPGAVQGGGGIEHAGLRLVLVVADDQHADGGGVLECVAVATASPAVIFTCAGASWAWRWRWMTASAIST